MSDNMCEHGGLDGNCLRCKDATITRLEAEKAALREEAALYQDEVAHAETFVGGHVHDFLAVIKPRLAYLLTVVGIVPTDLYAVICL